MKSALQVIPKVEIRALCRTLAFFHSYVVKLCLYGAYCQARTGLGIIDPAKGHCNAPAYKRHSVQSCASNFVGTVCRRTTDEIAYFWATHGELLADGIITVLDEVYVVKFLISFHYILD